MDGLMMDYELVVPKILQRAARVFPEKEIVCELGGHTIRYDYAELYRRVVRLANVLRKLGVQRGDRVATFAWNHHRHLELYFAVPAMGAVLHTVNLRLSTEQLRYIVNHAEDRVMFVDDSLLAPIEAQAAEFPSIRQYVVMTESGRMPETSLSPAAEYEALMAEADEREDFPELQEREACGLCYTSGTTGDPKGVLYSHRAIYLHTMMACMTDVLGFSERDVVLPIVPMFHANAWGTPYNCAMMGAKLVFAGSNVQPDHIVHLIERERVTLAMGVPTIWNNLLQYLDNHPADLSSLRAMVVGGSAVPRSMIETFRNKYGVLIIQGWGMTEMSPLGTAGRLTKKMEDWPEARQLDVLAKAGQLAPNVEAKLIGDDGEELPWDGKSVGELLVRGPCVARGYYNNPEAAEAFTEDGWFRTGDVAAIDEYAMLTISDRTKDLIKSGGEWISSVEMENVIMACPGVMEAAVVARPDEKWDERPLAYVVRAEGGTEATPEAIVEALAQTFAKWQLPAAEDIRFIDAIPKTGVGKFDKKVLRAMLRESAGG